MQDTYFEYPLKVFQSRSPHRFYVADAKGRCLGQAKYDPKGGHAEELSKLIITTLARGLNEWYEIEVLNEQQSELTFHVELCGRDGEAPPVVMATCETYPVAKAAFDGAIVAYPKQFVSLRQRARLIHLNEPLKPTRSP